MGLSNGYLGKMKERKGSIGSDVLEKIFSEYSDLNAEWLFTGSGGMFKLENIRGGAAPVNAPLNAPLITQSQNELYINPAREVAGELILFPFQHKYGEGKFDYLNPRLDLLPIYIDKATDQELVRVIDEPVFASYSAGFQDVNFLKKLELETIPKDLRNKGTICKFYVYGDSMEPSVHHGDYVFASYVERLSGPEQFKIRDSHMYVINSREGGLMLKRLYHHRGSDHVDCLSDNPDKKTHPNFSIHYDDIQELWYVRRRYSAQLPPPPEDNPLDTMQRLQYATAKGLSEMATTLKEMKDYIQLKLPM